MAERRSGAARPRAQHETVEAAVRNGLQAHQTVTVLPGVIPSISNDAEFFPGLKKSWSYTFMVNDEDAPTGRPAGALGWAGLPNLFYWIDRKNGFGGYWATQILPFGDPISFGAYMDFETAAYAAGQARGQRNAGAPFAAWRLPQNGRGRPPARALRYP